MPAEGGLSRMEAQPKPRDEDALCPPNDAGPAIITMGSFRESKEQE